MKGLNNTRFILLHPSSLPTTKPSATSVASPPPSPIISSHHRLWLLLFLSLFTLASLLTLLSTASNHSQPLSFSPTLATEATRLPSHIFDTLLHYASLVNSSTHMPEPDMLAIASVLRRRAPCNMLVFGLGAESPLWRALNHGGRTVFLDENSYYAEYMEGQHPGLETYDVSYTTQVRDLHDLLASARESRNSDCRPVQNLLFSECRLALNDLPNQLYDVNWDVILVDGPRGYSSKSPGRMAAIFTASVLARSAKRDGTTDIMVHDYDREVERVCSEEFLCLENFREETGTPYLAHYVINGGNAARRDTFCSNVKTEEEVEVEV
ncbi:glucuronoxylan 4-O-methyltransferase-like protein (DUF579) [Rhynchospora pubera]|uniref:Glucuronoxylan 4-O-methyltransferase-like protein (DUF579) n=1 Tax=Rhynchospora pubera TaxID=906938 RepID=A0AAV8HL39_9POAL|nr:glucuronoxylan 4-O-methyltransferase-like protein (DUF579) [Rhynchospora pubera]